MMTIRRGISLVQLADTATLLATSTVLGDAEGPPTWVRCIANGNDERSASRITVVRSDGEDCHALWARVVGAIRSLKESRGITHSVMVFCYTSAAPSEPEQGDRRFNMQRALWHEVDHEHDPDQRVRALGLLTDLSLHRGELPEFQ
jgi:hypothetical protein